MQTRVRASRIMRPSNRNFNPPISVQNGVQMPYRIVGFCLSNAPPKEHSSLVPVISNKACVYLWYTETSTQDGKLF